MAGSSGGFLVNPNTGSYDGGVQAGTSKNLPGGIYVCVAVASAWNAATMTLQMLGPDGATWLAAGTNTTFTANGNGVAYLAPGQVRANVTGGTPTGLFVSIARVVE